MRSVARDRVSLARAQCSAFTGHGHRDLAAKDETELLVLVPVLGHFQVRLEVDHGHGDPLAVDRPGHSSVPYAIGTNTRHRVKNSDVSHHETPLNSPTKS